MAHPEPAAAAPPRLSDTRAIRSATGRRDRAPAVRRRQRDPRGEEGIPALHAAFADRLRAVEAWEGFQGLELLADRREPGRFLMVSRWASREVFVAYMRSMDHQRSHRRIPRGPHSPRAAGFDEFDLVAR